MNFIENNGKKIASLLCVASAFPVVATIYAMETEPGWHGDVYVNEDTTVAKGWQEIEGKKYYFSEEDGKVENDKTAKAAAAVVNTDASQTIADDISTLSEEAVNAFAAEVEEGFIIEANAAEVPAPEVEAPIEEVVTPEVVAPEVVAPEVEEVVTPEIEAPEVNTPAEEEVETPAEPEVEAPAETPAEPETPEVPEEPVETPAEPEVEAPAETPAEPETPEVPEAPVETPEAPVEPEAPEVPETPVEPEAPVETPSTNTSLNQNIANAAMGLVGVTNGWQCTEVATQALQNAGVTNAQVLWPDQYIQYGTWTDNPQPGNLIYYYQGGRGVDHIAVYIGDGMAVHGNYNGQTVIASATLSSGSGQYIQINGQ